MENKIYLFNIFMNIEHFNIQTIMLKHDTVARRLSLKFMTMCFNRVMSRSQPPYSTVFIPRDSRDGVIFLS